MISYHGIDNVQERKMWFKELLINSSTKTLHHKVSKYHDSLDEVKQGGIIYLKIMMNAIYKMTEEVSKAAKTFIDNFSLRKLQGKNVTYTFFPCVNYGSGIGSQRERSSHRRPLREHP